MAKTKKDPPDCRISSGFPDQRLIFKSRSGNHALWAYRRSDTGKESVVALNCLSGFTDYPIRYDDGGVGWDRPEAFPASFRKSVQRLFGRRRR